MSYSSVSPIPFTPSQHLLYVYLDFNLNVPIPRKYITYLVNLTGNSYFKYEKQGG